MGHFKIDLLLDNGVTERLYVKPEQGESLFLEEIFPEDLNIRKWFVREAN